MGDPVIFIKKLIPKTYDECLEKAKKGLLALIP
jgi:hypothetical protein